MPDRNDGGVYITQREVYDEVRSMRAEFAEVCAEVKGLRIDLRAALDTKDDHETRLRDTEQRLGKVESNQEQSRKDTDGLGPRLRAVERNVWIAMGGATVLGGIGSAGLSAGLRSLMGGG